jgi:hypothetical protein
MVHVLPQDCRDLGCVEHGVVQVASGRRTDRREPPRPVQANVEQSNVEAWTSSRGRQHGYAERDLDLVVGAALRADEERRGSETVVERMVVVPSKVGFEATDRAAVRGRHHLTQTVRNQNGGPRLNG